MPIDALEKTIAKYMEDFDPKFVLPSESKETVIAKAARAIAHDIAFFDDWWFTAGTDEPDERLGRIKGSSNNEDWLKIIRYEVQEVLDELRDLDVGFVEPNQDDLVGKLAWYVENWKDWYYDVKMSSDQSAFFEMRGINREIYEDDVYGTTEELEGVSNAYDDDQVPYPDKDFDVEPAGLDGLFPV